MAFEALKAEIREDTGKNASRRTRREGLIPCVLYGHKEESIALSVPRKSFEAYLRTGQHMIDLGVADKTETVLVKELQHDPVSDIIIHADFERVAMDEEVTIEVPIVLKGKAAGVDEGGVMDQVMKTLEVVCLPASIPQNITIDVSSLAINDTFQVKDIDLPEDVKPTADEDETVAVVHPPETEEDDVLEEEPGQAEPEVITAAEPSADEESGEDKPEPEE